jgi:hypothetical protein
MISPEFTRLCFGDFSSKQAQDDLGGHTPFKIKVLGVRLMAAKQIASESPRHIQARRRSIP